MKPLILDCSLGLTGPVVISPSVAAGYPAPFDGRKANIRPCTTLILAVMVAVGAASGVVIAAQSAAADVYGAGPK